MERFDAAVIGAGPEGLVAASMLAQAGLKTVVLERSGEAGGRATSVEFHPGYWASPFADELPAIPARIFRALNLSRHGAILAPALVSLSISDEGESALFADNVRALRNVPLVDRDALREFRRALAQFDAELDRRVADEEPRPESRAMAVWPGESWTMSSLEEALAARFATAVLRLHLASDAVAGRAVAPSFPGSALHLLAPGIGRSGMAIGGLGGLGGALERCAKESGASLRFDSAVDKVRLRRGRAIGIALAGGEEVRTRAVISALDLKRTFMVLVPWKSLDEFDARRVAQFRMAGQRARVLIALDAIPDFTFAKEAPELALGPVHVAPGMAGLSRAYGDWRRGVIPENPLVTLRVPSFVDPRLAPVGKAVMSATLSSIPTRLVDGPWDEEKRQQLAAVARAAADRASPGIARLIAGLAIVTPADIEGRLGLTEGDLDGGMLAPDQGLGSRPFPDWPGGRTPVRGLYLAGPSAAPAPFLTGASGERAARAAIADLREGLLP